MVTYSLKQSVDGLWSLCRAEASLFHGLQLSAAIRLAREVARDEHFRSGRVVRVEMPGTGSSIRLAHYARYALPLEKAA
ncbi:hypothetical protein [Dyella sp. ASV21]|jgi:hypothetical protein|uniref:hypothetical protein n=1 Tax=Dyella sp. ASV21 TaxID=2795114 RepID=UPI0018ED1BE8|nr:hypothetical protein [Dyella sp. ASV21]